MNYLEIAVMGILLFVSPQASKVKGGGAVAPQAAPANPPAPTKAETVEAKESTAWLKQQLAMLHEKEIQQKAIAMQTEAQQKLEPYLLPLKKDFDVQVKVVTDNMDVVKKENGFGDDVVLDQNLNSPTFGKWVKTKK